jgi:outer membrane lipoprotein carrier protein
MRINRIVLLGFLLALPALAVAASKPTPARHLAHLLKGLKSLKADFSQTVTHATLPGAKKSHGTVLIKQPYRFRWHYVAPDKQIIDSDGKHIWMYDMELAQVTVKPLKTTLADSPAMLLSGKGTLRQAFKVADETSKNGLDWVTLKPKSHNAAFRKVRIGLGKHHIRVMELTSAKLNQVTKIKFQNVVRNPHIPESVFKFTPPPHTDVIGAPDSAAH